MNLGEKLMKARCRLLTREPWYGHIAMGMTWIALPEEADCKTMGVRIVNGGDMQCVYNPHFVEELTLEELYAVVQHEIEHLVRLHCVRIDFRDTRAWNIAADMCVNGRKSNPRIGYKDPIANRTIIPHIDDIVWIPDSWPDNETVEQYYERLTGKGCGNQALALSVAHSVRTEAVTGPARALDDHQVWRESNVGLDEARQVVRDLVSQATEKCQGNSPGHLREVIAKLNNPIMNWRQLLKHHLGKHVGNRRTTYSRRNRRRDQFGVPGISRRAAANVNVIVDTSGSISTEDLRQFFAEIESISCRAKTAVLQWDTVFQGWSAYRRGCWKSMAINGRGGTDMAAPVKWLIDNRKVADVQIMLTDGFCNYLPGNQVRFPVITVITNKLGDKPEYGDVVRMK